ncbi:TsoY family (seleno)protein [Thauera phenolivorans]|uniref:TsoY family (seleno)protein n=1 Tax=Thauera phenolivorans TaxID=1792543 RepID=UPI001E35B141|nr:hypothetical protein [Thauera phenolivorans]
MSGSSYHPSYWLAALGAGGLSVSFFMYLMWLLPHPGFPMPTWEHLQGVWTGGAEISTSVRFVSMAATLAVIVLAALHFALLWWNIREYRAPANRPDLDALRDTPAEVQLMAVPLTLAMTVNVGFVLGALFVPGLWSAVEYLFPFALIAFLAIGWSALRIFGRYLSRFLVHGGYRGSEHNHLSALLAVFTFSMLSVGFAAPAAMSHLKLVSALAATLSILFFVIAITVAVIVLVGGAAAMMTHGLQPKATPSIWMLVPILTLLGIEWVRLRHGLAHHFSSGNDSGGMFYMLTAIFMLQIGVMLIGLRVMQLNGYLRLHLAGEGRDPVSFGLICPGVALFVMGMFWWHLAWVDSGLIAKYSAGYWIGIGLLAIVQLATLLALLRLSWTLMLGRETRIVGVDA